MGVFVCGDGRFLTVVATDESLLSRLADIVGIDRHGEDLNAALEEAFRSRPRAEWLGELEKAGVPSGPVNNLEEAVNDTYARARQVVSWVDHPELGRIPQVTFAAKLTDTPAVIRSRPPLLGEHTDTVLGEIGYAPSEVAAFRSGGAI
jgi:crotonobetainyl-CoA:carnitine CoA-transferase CaiB-like acyl-CoA transferase